MIVTRMRVLVAIARVLATLQKKNRKWSFGVLDRIDDGEFNGGGLETL